MEITYTKYNDYLLPNLTLTEKKNKRLNKYGLLKLNYIKKYDKVTYNKLLMKNELNEYLFLVGTIAEKKIKELIKELIAFENIVNEELKESNQLLWIQKMNNYKCIAEEIVLKEYIYV